jgi:hypothetical protein
MCGTRVTVMLNRICVMDGRTLVQEDKVNPYNDLDNRRFL